MDFGDFMGLVAILASIIGLPWLVLHYVTQWKKAPKITIEDEKLLDELHFTARRLEERLNTIERIVAADNPEFRLRGMTTQDAISTDYDYRKGN